MSEPIIAVAPAMEKWMNEKSEHVAYFSEQIDSGKTTLEYALGFLRNRCRSLSKWQAEEVAQALEDKYD